MWDPFYDYKASNNMGLKPTPQGRFKLKGCA